MRQQSQEVTIDYEEKKHAYDSMAAGLESNNAKLESVRSKSITRVAARWQAVFLHTCDRDCALWSFKMTSATVHK